MGRDRIERIRALNLLLAGLEHSSREGFVDEADFANYDAWKVERNELISLEIREFCNARRRWKQKVPWRERQSVRRRRGLRDVSKRRIQH